MEAFGFAALFGLILGFMFGVGCAAAVLYTIYMGGYRKAVSDSLQEHKSPRYEAESLRAGNQLTKSQADAAEI